MLDESEPLAGLLRKCLMLGAETGSTALRDWARKELSGYRDDDDVPGYRKLPAAIRVDSTSGNTWTKGQIIDRLHMPQACQEYVPEVIPFPQPIEELGQLASRDSLSFTNPGLAHAQVLWDRELGPFQSIVNLSYTLPGSAVAGILGQIRTQLVDLIADLTADTPLAELPSKAHVDAAVRDRITAPGNTYNTTIHEASGAVAIGAGAHAEADGVSVEDVMRLLQQVSEVSTDVQPEDRDELMRAVADLRAAVSTESPDTGEVVKKAGALRVVGEKLGVASVAAAVGSAVQVAIDLALSGALG